MNFISDCIKYDLDSIGDRSGNISVIENYKSIPFSVKRVFYIYDIPGGRDRGAHAHIECHQFIIAVSGSFKVELFDGKNRNTIHLNRPYHGLHILPGIWASEQSFSSGAVCLVLASELYNESDYIRDYNDFIKFRHGMGQT
jgi:hypothetical protein